MARPQLSPQLLGYPARGLAEDDQPVEYRALAKLVGRPAGLVDAGDEADHLVGGLE
jgi:hypothetical protein